ncbi:MaoC family dehydratase [Azospirillum sp. RWY-5-1]|uniref:MaoC family dehydratase n=1 Tax=Azospirillum oleiclasticum TaxID=2735135 RepID=A0ABX2TJU1_9PROT|nr:MaoC family dehydratase N-terminal domain-containing protein [Azospirillum oleiclasticum]NYZ16535.1 MaoC family dehydratase [Azospirillum oleiclasticum]NYZ23995.1 MaoC family dehydratase [Azospirillum oleiclasticum]
MEIDRSLIGSVSDPYVVEVEKGAIRRFAEAIGDPNPVYVDADAARAAGFPGIIAPPTFPASFRAPEEPVWTRHLDRRRILAGEQAFHYERPILAGDRFDCRVHFVEVVDKDWRSGPVELLVQEVRGSDPEGRPVFVHRRTTIYRAARGGGA